MEEGKRSWWTVSFLWFSIWMLTSIVAVPFILKAEQEVVSLLFLLHGTLCLWLALLIEKHSRKQPTVQKPEPKVQQPTTPPPKAALQMQMEEERVQREKREQAEARKEQEWIEEQRQKTVEEARERLQQEKRFTRQDSPAVVGIVTKVKDGDSIVVDKIWKEIRMHGIDAPETAQPWGPEATHFLVRRCLGREVGVVQFTGHKDPWGRFLATVYLNTPTGPDNLNREMVRAGLA